MASGAQEKLLDDDNEGQCIPGEEGNCNDMSLESGAVVVAVDDEAPAATFAIAPIDPAIIIPAAAPSTTHDAIIPINPFHGQTMEGAPPSPHVRPHVGYAVEGRAATICRIPRCGNVSVHRCSNCHRNFCGVHCRIVIRPGHARPNGGRNSVRKCVECTRHEVAQRQRAARNRGMSQCCVRRLIVRLLIFFILIILASVYSSSSGSSSAV